jgi:alpha-glucosidase
MIDPGIKEDPEYAVYQDGLAKNMFLRTADGDVAKGPVWPGFCAFPDFTHPAVRTWWGDLSADLYQKTGMSGFWNDMNEPAVFHVNHKTLPDNVMHHYDGQPASHRKAHNVYGQQMNRASWEGFKRQRPEKRPFLLTRATFSGGQRYAAVWTGDNYSDWEHLQIAKRPVSATECFRFFVLRNRYWRICRNARWRIIYPLATTRRFPSAHAGTQHGTSMPEAI